MSSETPASREINLKVRLGKLELDNPIVVASGTFGWGLEFERIVGFTNNSIGAIVLKGTTLHARPGNVNPRIIETAGGAGILNSIGLENPGVKTVVEKYLPLLKSARPKIFANVAGTTPEEYAEVARHFADSPVISAVELNISCPNVKTGGMSFGCDPASAALVVSAVRKVTDLPLVVKLTPNVTDIRTVARAAIDSGADILSLINTLSGVAVDVRTRRHLLGNVAGGLSGPAIKPVALARLLEVHRMLKQLKLDVPIIGMGGIVTAEDALEFMITWARAFAIGTILFRDHTAPARILHDLAALCKEMGVADVNSLVGSIQLEDPT